MANITNPFVGRGYYLIVIDMRILRLFLFPVSLIFLVGVYVRNFLYRQGWFKVYKLSTPIISIGNLSTGGTGKTPMACFILDYLIQQGISVAYLSRGYGRSTEGFRRVTEHADAARLFGDEAVLIFNRFTGIPVAVCEDRVGGATRLIRESAVSIIVLDDAFQHQKIGRDLDIVMIDATQMPDRDLVLPAGNLREPLSSLSRAGIVVLNKIPEQADRQALIKRLKHPQIAVSKAQFAEVIFFRPEVRPALPSEVLLKHPVIVFSGLGNNEQFFDQLREMGVDIRKSFSFPDHHVYTPEDLKLITLEFRTQVPESPELIILTTEKDYCRLNSVNLPAVLTPYPCAYITMDLVWLEGKHLVTEELHKLVNKINHDRETTT